jgi:excisionase family DNA binding protein
MRDIMTPDEVAEHLRVSTSTVYRLIREDHLAASRVGRTYRMPREDVETYLLVHSNRADVRRDAFGRVLAIADRNPDLSSDDVLEELEARDAERKLRAGAG